MVDFGVCGMMLEIALYFSIGVLCTVFAGAALVIIWNDYDEYN